MADERAKPARLHQHCQDVVTDVAGGPEAVRSPSTRPSSIHQGSLNDDGLVVLARHGRTELNAAGLLRGHLDPALDSVGETEVLALGRAVAQTLAGRPVVRIVCSPLRRAIQTASAIAAALPEPPVVQAAQGLIDRDYGHWAGHSREEVQARFGSVDAADGVESAIAVTERARAALDAQLPLLASGALVLVAHDAVNRLLLASLDPGLGPADEIGQSTACWNLLSYRDHTWQVDRVDQKVWVPD